MSTIGKRGRTVSEIRKGLAFNKSWGDTDTRAHTSHGETQKSFRWGMDHKQWPTDENTLRGSGGRLRTQRGILGAGGKEEQPEAWKGVGAQQGRQRAMWQRLWQEARVTSWLLRKLKSLKLILPCEFSWEFFYASLDNWYPRPMRFRTDFYLTQTQR